MKADKRHSQNERFCEFVTFFFVSSSPQEEKHDDFDTECAKLAHKKETMVKRKRNPPLMRRSSMEVYRKTEKKVD